LSAAKKEKNDAKRDRRAASGSAKSFSWFISVWKK
jgi:hypothetical protein